MTGDTLELGPWANCGACETEIPTPRDGIRMGGAVLCTRCVASSTEFYQCDNCRIYRPDTEPMSTPHGEGRFCASCRQLAIECPECGDANLRLVGKPMQIAGRMVHVEPWRCPACGHKE